MDSLFDMRLLRPGFRLQKLEVMNWGTFDSSDGQVYRFEPDGRTCLLVGQNGTGKSTLVDGMLTLLVEPRTRNYNVAAGAGKRERTPETYIQGAFKRTIDESESSAVEYLRPRSKLLTALLAVFHDEELEQAFTLLQVHYLTSDGADRYYAFHNQTRELQHDLAHIASVDAVRNHLESHGYQVTRTFNKYHGWFTKRARMRSKATDMFNQTVAVKDIDSLNRFIREHMLEAHDWNEKVQKLLVHFKDLSLAHQELVRARRAQELLNPVERAGRRFQEKSEELSRLNQSLAASELFFSEQIVKLFVPRIETENEKLTAVIDRKGRLQSEQNDVIEQIRVIKNDIDAAGGERLREIPNLIRVQESNSQRKRENRERFADWLARAGIEHPIESPAQFDLALNECREAREKIDSSAGEQQSKLEADYVARANLSRQLREDEAEFGALNERKSNLPPWLAAIRSHLCVDLQIDEAALPFAAELMAVSPDHRDWEPSIEMVLRSFALSLLVPERFYRRVRLYVEQNVLADHHGKGCRLVYLRVGNTEEISGDRIDLDAMIRKLQFRDRHALTPWVRGVIQQRFNYQCCESVNDFNESNRQAMTRNRHIKTGSERHEKDDRPHVVNPRNFVLGWDNRVKQRLIAELIRDSQEKLGTLDRKIEALAQAIQAANERRLAVTEALKFTDFDLIDAVCHDQEAKSLRLEEQQLKNENEKVQALESRLRQAELALEQLQEERDETLKAEERLAESIKSGETILNKARVLVDGSKRAGEYDSVVASFEFIAMSVEAEGPLTVENLFERQGTWRKRTESQIENLRKAIEPLENHLTDAMGKYLREFTEETDLSPNVRSLTGFLGRLDHVREEDLPRHTDNFKRRLNERVSQEVGTFRRALRRECQMIEAKIEELNKALSTPEYNPGTCMRLEPRPTKDPKISEFKRMLQECLDESLENTDEANEARFLRIEKLVERLADKERSTWRKWVIDVRNWFNFRAREIEIDNPDKTVSSYEDSSGQSGGEKVKLAFTILVAAIAYQYDLNPHGTSSGHFHFVIVDEMFKNVDDPNAEYALKLFERFGLQLLIVSPLDGKARVAEPFVDCYLLTDKCKDTFKSRLFAMTAQEYEEVVKRVEANGQSQSRVGLNHSRAK